MELTGKCKIEFDNYLKKHYHYTDDEGIAFTDDFYELPPSMQWGVLQDFAYFDNNWDLYIKPIGIIYSVYLDFEGHHLITDYLYFLTRQEARAAAIEKFNEIYNK